MTNHVSGPGAIDRTPKQNQTILWAGKPLNGAEEALLRLFGFEVENGEVVPVGEKHRGHV